MPKGRGSISFQAEGDRIHLSATYVKTDSSPQGIEFMTNGKLSKRIELQPNIGFHQLELTLICHPGINQVEIKHANGVESELIFTKLLLNDVAPRN